MGAADVKAGEHILFAKYAGSEVTIEDQEFLIMREDEVLASGRRRRQEIQEGSIEETMSYG